MSDPVTCPVERGRRLARRRMAWTSFWLLVTSCSAVLGMLLFSDDRAAVADALDTAQPVLTSILTVFTSIVLGYLGVSAAERVFKKD